MTETEHIDPSEAMKQTSTSLSPELKESCELIIHTASVAAAAATAIPFPFADSAALVPIQVTMITALYNAFDKKIADGLATGVATQVLTVTLGRSVVKQLFKLIPGAGPVLGFAFGAGTAVAITEALGWAIVALLADGKDNDSIPAMIAAIIELMKKIMKK